MHSLYRLPSISAGMKIRDKFDYSKRQNLVSFGRDLKKVVGSIVLFSCYMMKRSWEQNPHDKTIIITVENIIRNVFLSFTDYANNNMRMQNLGISYIVRTKYVMSKNNETPLGDLTKVHTSHRLCNFVFLNPFFFCITARCRTK